MSWIFVLALVAAVGCAKGVADETAKPSGPGSGGGGGFSPGAIQAVRIEPADAVIVVQNGVIPAQLQFKAVGVDGNGKEVKVFDGGQWSFDRPDAASIDAAGAMTASGHVGAKGTLAFALEGITASTSVTLRLQYSSNPDQVGDEVKKAFAAATETDSVLDIVYPYDDTIYPRGLPGPAVHCNGAGPGDVYYMFLEHELFVYQAWAKLGAKGRFEWLTMPVDAWRTLTDTLVGDVTLSVQRYDGTKAFLPQTRTIRIAEASLAGSITYHEVYMVTPTEGAGTTVRLKPGQSAALPFLQTNACVGCHSVSKDGSRIAGALHGFSSPWASFDAQTGALLHDSAQPSGFQAISPHGTHVLWGHWTSTSGSLSDGFMRLSPYNDTSSILGILDPPGEGYPGHPEWSGDGKYIAFSVRTDPQGLAFSDADLWIAQVDLATGTFSDEKKIIDNDSTWPCVTYPTFSPDSKWIAFERGTSSHRPANGQLWITNLDGSVSMRLDAANGVGKLANGQDATNVTPMFLPVAVGGYYWLVWSSERKYGNLLEDTAIDTRQKQLWVTAIDANPTPGKDPSHPPFWLPGQRTDRQNMRGQWALDPCKQIGELCNAGYECCDGFCQKNEANQWVCAPDSSQGCSAIGEACDTAADCCDPEAECIFNFCALKLPK